MLWFLSASVVALATTLIHALAGGRDVMGPVHAAQFPKLVRGTLAVAWHAITLQLLASAVVLAWAALGNHPHAAVVTVVLINLAAFAGLFFVYGLVVFRSPLVLPQWLLLGPPALLGAIGLGGHVALWVPAVLAALVLVGIAAVHVLWAVGGVWPARDEATLVRTVVGADKTHMPPAWMSLTVAVVLVGAAACVVALRLDPWPAAWVRTAVWATAAVMGVRGVGGYAERFLRPQIRKLPYDRANRWFYSPLALVVALAAAVTAGA